MSKTLQITPIRTDIFRQQQDLAEFVFQNLVNWPLTDTSLLAVTSKIVSLSEGRVVSKSSIDKDALITAEADYDLGEMGYGCRLTIKDGLFIPAAGIDESNSETDSYILFPKNGFESARKLHTALTKKYGIKNLGILITDSHTLPLRQGVTGIALAYWGFKGVRDKIGEKDLFGRSLKMTKMDLADGLAAAAVLMMGEAAEQCPLAIINNAPVEFCDDGKPEEIRLSPEQDLYYPLYRERIKKLLK